jgi:hypothetical protein
MESVLWSIDKVITYIDDLLIHTENDDKHLKILDSVHVCLKQNHLKINLNKCFFRNKEVSYLGFTLPPEGIKPRRNKLKQLKMLNHLLMSKPFGPLSDFTTFLHSHQRFCNLRCTIVTNSHKNIWDTKEAHYPRMLSKLSALSRIS